MIMKGSLTNSYPRIAVFLQVLLLFLCSCLPYRCSVEEFTADHCQGKEHLYHHPLYTAIPPHRSVIYWYDLPHWISWALLGNDDDGIFGEGEKAQFRPEDSPWKRFILWTCRNPFHNTCFYALGSGHKTNSQFVFFSFSPDQWQLFCYHPESSSPFVSEKSSVLFALHGGKPFFSLRYRWCPHRQCESYLGWRERGNLGAKLRPYTTTVREQ